MATTYLDLVNRVLRKLGETELSGSSTDLETDYQKLVGHMVNDVKEEVEDATNWRALRQTVSVSILADAISGTITEGNERARLVRVYQSERTYGNMGTGGGYIPLVFDITDADNPDPLIEMDLAELIYRDNLDPTERASDSPTYFALDNSPDGDELDIYVWPRPSSARTLKVTLCVPQPRLADDELQTVIKAPARPIFIGAVWHAFEERGEELGPDALFSEKRFQEALTTAVARDEAESGSNFELIIE